MHNNIQIPNVPYQLFFNQIFTFLKRIISKGFVSQLITLNSILALDDDDAIALKQNKQKICIKNRLMRFAKHSETLVSNVITYIMYYVIS